MAAAAIFHVLMISSTGVSRLASRASCQRPPVLRNTESVWPARFVGLRHRAA